MKFPIGGTVRERNAPIWCDSKTNSKVWMKEGRLCQRMLRFLLHCRHLKTDPGLSGVFFFKNLRRTRRNPERNGCLL